MFGFVCMEEFCKSASCVLPVIKSIAYMFSSFLKQLFAYNSEGKSSPSEVVEHSTNPDKPGPPSKPTVKGKIHSHSVKVAWGRLPFVSAVFECFSYICVCNTDQRTEANSG